MAIKENHLFSENQAELISLLEAEVRTYLKAIRERVYDINAAVWSTMSPNYCAEVVGSTQLQTHEEFLEDRRNLAEEYPNYSMKELDLSTSLDKAKGKAECFLSAEITGAPEGVVRQSLGVLEFVRGDKLPKDVRKEMADGHEESWWCVSYRSFRGLGGEIMGSL